jgi:replication-associated recombination protein RarA
MLQGGEDPLYIARRLVRAASEDIGLADNTALPLVKNKKIFEWAGGDAGL